MTQHLFDIDVCRTTIKYTESVFPRSRGQYAESVYNYEGLCYPEWFRIIALCVDKNGKTIVTFSIPKRQALLQQRHHASGWLFP